MDFNCFAAICACLIAAAYGQRGELNARCTVVADCNNVYAIQRYFCSRNRTCQCMPNYVPDKSFQKCIGIIDQRCKYDDQCIDGAYCKENTLCECKEDLYPTFDQLQCSNSTNTHKQRSILLQYLLPLLLNFLRIRT